MTTLSMFYVWRLHQFFVFLKASDHQPLESEEFCSSMQTKAWSSVPQPLNCAEFFALNIVVRCSFYVKPFSNEVCFCFNNFYWFSMKHIYLLQLNLTINVYNEVCFYRYFKVSVSQIRKTKQILLRCFSQRLHYLGFGFLRRLCRRAMWWDQLQRLQQAAASWV